MSKAPFAPINFAAPAVTVEELDGGGMLLSSPQALEAYAERVADPLIHWASTAPDRTFLAERDADGRWRRISYRQALQQVEALAQALLDRGVDADSPVVILSGNGVDMALLQLAAMHIGAPAAPISPAYSLMSGDHAKLKHIVGLLQPKLIYVANAAPFTKAFAALDLSAVELVTSSDAAGAVDATPFSTLLDTPVTTAVGAALARTGPDSVAKILFTSGSTGMPKGVLNTQRMLCSNQQAIIQCWRFLTEQPPVFVDWLPWNHTFGGNHNFNMALFNGGTLYVDAGKPVPGLIEQTVANLREISPTVYFNVPVGFDGLLPFLEQDAELRDNFFRDLQLIFYAGAALPQNLWERIEQVSVQSRGVRVPLVSAWGSTETAPLNTIVHYPLERAGVIGNPAPGTEVKLVPNSGKLELRVRGPNIMPGYYKDQARSAEAFDADGFYCMGDAGKLADPDDPAKGIVFDGRVAENFKLMSGTWVHVGALRIAAIAAGAPLMQDAVVTGHAQEEVGLLIFPNRSGCLSVCPDVDAEIPLPALLARPEVRAQLVAGLQVYNREHPGSSNRVARILLMSEPPNIDANEITDKGYINQRAVLERRTDLVERLYADDPDVILV